MNNNKVLIFSIALEGYSQLFRDCIETHRHYCSKYGFTYSLIEKAPKKLLPSEAAWLKLFLLKTALECNYDWVAFIDADCEIRNHAPSFMQEMNLISEKKSIFMGTGFSGRINSGVIFIRKSMEAKNYLETIIKNCKIEVPDEDKALYENGHIIHYGKNNPDIQLFNSNEWNNNMRINDESYIQHYSGGKLRGVYLNQQSPPVKSKSENFLLRKIKARFPGKKKPPNIHQLNLFIPFFKYKYSAFNCEN